MTFDRETEILETEDEGMLTEAPEDLLEPDAEEEQVEEEGGLLDAESLFVAELRRTSVLSRSEEDVLARRIEQARSRVRRHLRQARRLCHAGLADSGRGVVMPDEAFRERETIAILKYAQQQERTPHPERTTGMKKKELREFVKNVSAALDEYRLVRDRMMQANIRLVSLLARRYHHPTLTFLDLVQEGTIGLIRAIEKYETGKNVKFSTYAVYWIWQQLSRAADTHGALIRTPVHWNQARRRLNREIPQGSGSTAPPEAGDDTAIDPERLHVMTQPFRFVSTDAPLNSDDEDRTLESVLASDEPEPEMVLLQENLRQRMGAVVDRLPHREAEILRRRFGLGDDESETLDEIGTTFHVSRERIRQLETRALKRLRDLCAAEGLDEYLH